MRAQANLGKPGPPAQLTGAIGYVVTSVQETKVLWLLCMPGGPFALSPLSRRMGTQMTDGVSNTANHLVAFFDEQPKQRKKTLGVELLSIDQSHGFVLPGPAVANVVYVRHPVNERELIPFADYDERIARDLYEEALRVVTKLGAARIVARSHSEMTKRASLNLGLKVLRFDGGAKKDAAWSLAADLEGDGAAPIDPRPLRYDDIAGLDAVCEGVLNNGWRKGNIRVTQSSILGVDGELAGGLEKAGFKLGVGGGKAKVTEFVIEAAFTPEAAQGLDAIVAATEEVPAPGFFRRRKPA